MHGCIRRRRRGGEKEAGYRGRAPPPLHLPDSFSICHLPKGGAATMKADEVAAVVWCIGSRPRLHNPNFSKCSSRITPIIVVHFYQHVFPKCKVPKSPTADRSLKRLQKLFVSTLSFSRVAFGKFIRRGGDQIATASACVISSGDGIPELVLVYPSRIGIPAVRESGSFPVLLHLPPVTCPRSPAPPPPGPPPPPPNCHCICFGGEGMRALLVLGMGSQS